MDTGFLMEGDHRLRPVISFGISCASPLEDNADFTPNSISPFLTTKTTYSFYMQWQNSVNLFCNNNIKFSNFWRETICCMFDRIYNLSAINAITYSSVQKHITQRVGISFPF